MRPGEVAGLRWPDYEPSTGRITVARALVAREQVPPKTKRSKRTITLEPEARAAIEMVHQRRPWIFTTKQLEPWDTRHTLRHTWVLAQSNIKIRYRPQYAMRKTYISLALSHGAPALAVAQYTGTSLAMLHIHYAKYISRDDTAPLGRALQAHFQGAQNDAQHQLQLFDK